jgi:hypothetical protein
MPAHAPQIQTYRPVFFIIIISGVRLAGETEVLGKKLAPAPLFENDKIIHTVSYYRFL